MLHCPYCGSIVKEEETFCVRCGKELPKDIHLRTTNKQKFNRFWFIPLVTLGIVILTINLFNSFLQHQTSEAKELYVLGEKSLEKDDYQKAKQYFQEAIKQKPNFVQGQTALEFITKKFEIEEILQKVNEELENREFQSALTLINDAESSLKNFDGSEVTKLVERLVVYRNTVKLEQIKSQLSDNPSIDELKVLLWEADAIKNPEATQITETIRSQIIDFTYTKASEQLSEKQFTDAQFIVEDGLKYAPNSEKLQSLKTTIEKEKVTFEITQQERIQQAIDTAAEEREMNENDAIDVVSVKLENDKQDNLVVKGEVKSIATIPISSILVEYSLLTNDQEFLSNEVYVYPDTLYPNETGKFEFTHYDIDQKVKSIDINVKKITWYTNY